MKDRFFLEQCKRACRFMNEAVEDDELSGLQCELDLISHDDDPPV